MSDISDLQMSVIHDAILHPSNKEKVVVCEVLQDSLEAFQELYTTVALPEGETSQEAIVEAVRVYIAHIVEYVDENVGDNEV